MPFYRCEICHDDGRVVARHVMVSLETREQDDPAAWYGSISTQALTSLAAGERYRLVLEDGRSGVFVVRRNTTAGGDDRAIAIVGAGPLA
jgi:hypothetical protein